MTLIEVIVAVGVVGMVVVLAVGGAQPGADRQAKIARCANNLRMLAAADHCYADDFKEKLFLQLGVTCGSMAQFDLTEGADGTMPARVAGL